MTPYWHEHNPWRNDLVYVSIEELAECYSHKSDPVSRWFQYGNKLDPYILPGKHSITAGIRFGPEDSDYLSPGFDENKLRELLKKYVGNQDDN